jgi:predicted PurR-regulated permease PerM
MNSTLKLPFYAKAGFLLLGIYISINMLFIGQDIILPLIYATLIAILLNPLVNILVKKRLNRAVAIAIVLISALLLIAILVLLLYSQANRLSNAWPHLVIKFKNFFDAAISWSSNHFNISSNNINTQIADAKSEIMDNKNNAIGLTLTTMGGVLSTIFLTPVYIFMILLYQSHLLKFTHTLFDKSNSEKLGEVLTETKAIIQSYLVGLFVEMTIVMVLNSVGLLILGIDYAILLGILGAVLNIIPYLGGIIAMAIYMVIALITKSPIYVFYVAGMYTFIQLIDNNYIVPKIVGSKVKLNALISLVVVIAGAALWGIPGMFLSIPLTAIAKVIFDHIEPLKPYGFLLGNDLTDSKNKIKIN